MAAENFDDVMFHVGRDGRQLGQFNGSQLRDGLVSGEFKSTDLVWRDGMANWLPLVSMLVLNGETIKTDEVVISGAAQGESSPNVRVVIGSDRQVILDQRPTSGYAIACLVIGAAPILVCPVGLISWLPGLICGHIALSRIKEQDSKFQGTGIAIAGLILNYLWLLMLAGAIIFFVMIGMAAKEANA